MKERLGRATQLSNMTKPPPRNVQTHAREIEGTVFHPSAIPSGAPTGGRWYKEVAERSEPMDVLVYTASALQAERDMHLVLRGDARGIHYWTKLLDQIYLEKLYFLW